MTKYQNKRIVQLIDKLIDNKITNTEYTEYQYLCNLLSGNYMPLEEIKIRKISTKNPYL